MTRLSGPWPLALVLALMLAVLVASFFTLIALDPTAWDTTGQISPEAMVLFGIKDDLRIADGHLAGLVRAGLVHLSPTHLIVNSVSLALFSGLLWRLVPLDQRNTSRAAAVICLAVIASTGGFLMSFAVGNGLSAGASAAVFGVLGALPLALVARHDLGPRKLRWTLAAMLLALGGLGVAVLAGHDGVDHAAHLGGLLTGLPLGYAQAHRPGRIALIALGLGLVALGFTPV